MTTSERRNSRLGEFLAKNAEIEASKQPIAAAQQQPKRSSNLTEFLKSIEKAEQPHGENDNKTSSATRKNNESPSPCAEYVCCM